MSELRGGSLLRSPASYLTPPPEKRGKIETDTTSGHVRLTRHLEKERPEMTAQRVALVHVRTDREHAREYQMLDDRLNLQAMQTLTSDGWEASLHAAGDGTLEDAVAFARNADLVILMGGEDVHPSLYGGAQNYSGRGNHDLAADEAQIAIVHDALKRGAPLLGICRGHQLLNVALGGNLIQHLPADGVHRSTTARSTHALGPFTPHTVQLHGSLAGFQGAAARGSLSVQSSHHQAVQGLGAGLRTAADHDGLIEAVGHVDAPVFGVQWHPEHPAANQQHFAQLARFVHGSAAETSTLQDTFVAQAA